MAALESQGNLEWWTSRFLPRQLSGTDSPRTRSCTPIATRFAWDLGDGFTMIIGANQAAIVLEVGYIQGSTAIVIVYAMRAREKFLR